MGEALDKLNENRSGSFEQGMLLLIDNLALIHPIAWNCYWLENGI